MDHLIWCIKQNNELTKDWMGNLYCGIMLNWDYDACTLDIFMPGYIKKLLLKYKHKMPSKQHHCPYAPSPKQYGAKAQAPLPVNISPNLSPKEIKEIQHFISSILNYARAVDITVLMALSSIAIEQSKNSTNMMAKIKQLLDYLETYLDANTHFWASDMILNVHSDALYLSEHDARGQACGHFLMGWSPKDGNSIRLNRAFFTLCAILHFFVTLAAEAKLGTLFLSCKEGILFWLTLEELEHPQLQIPVHCNNATAVGIANNTVKCQCSCLMEIDYFWIVTRLHKISITSDGTWDKKILLIIKASTTLGPTIKLYAPGTYMRIFRPQYYCEKPDLAL
jgi:hypothetical protein